MIERENVSIFDIISEPIDPEECKKCLFMQNGYCEYKIGIECSADYTPDFKRMNFEEVVSYISEKLKVPIVKDKLVNDEFDDKPFQYQEYKGKSGKVVFTIHLDKYFDSEIPFISLDVIRKGDPGHGGFGSPCDSINEVIETLRRQILLYG